MTPLGRGATLVVLVAIASAGAGGVLVEFWSPTPSYPCNHPILLNLPVNSPIRLKACLIDGVQASQIDGRVHATVGGTFHRRATGVRFSTASQVLVPIDDEAFARLIRARLRYHGAALERFVERHPELRTFRDVQGTIVEVKGVGESTFVVQPSLDYRVHALGVMIAALLALLGVVAANRRWSRTQSAPWTF